MPDGTSPWVSNLTSREASETKVSESQDRISQLMSDRSKTNDRDHIDRIDVLIKKHRSIVDQFSGFLTEHDIADNRVEAPEYLKELAETGIPKDVMRAMVMQEGVPGATQANTQKRQTEASFSRAGFGDSGFQNQALKQAGAEKDFALNQLRTSVDLQSSGMQQEAMQRLRNVQEFNESMTDRYRQFGQSKSFEMSEMIRNYQNQLNQENAQEEAAKGQMWGNLASIPLNFIGL